MAKVKNKRNAGLADRVHNKKKAEANKKKLNPFEVHINKEKLKVLGKKSKHDRGLPGVARAKAIQKRKETLGTEMKLLNKTNTFIDRRIGEKNNQISAEDRMIARFAAERVKQHSKKSIYNLADDEILTHRGQTLEQIEKFDDPRSSDDEDEEKQFGGLDNDFVSEGHFGGGVLSKAESKDGAKSHKDLIEQLIAESKKRKAEKQKEKEQTLDLTEKLDSEWKDLQPVVFKKQKVQEESLIDKLLSKAEKGQDYDKMMRELRFEKRGTPSDGLKSKEKQDEEERKKIEELERQRELRMISEEAVTTLKNAKPPKHRSADDLDDNFELEDEKEFMLAYDKDGKPLVPEHVLKDYSVPNAKKVFDDGVSDTSDEEGDNEEESDEDDNEVEDGNTDEKNEATKSEDSDEETSDESESEQETEKSNKKGSTKNRSENLKESKGSKRKHSSNSDDEIVSSLDNSKKNKVKSKTETESLQSSESKSNKLNSSNDKNVSDEENDEDEDDEDDESSDDSKDGSDDDSKFNNLNDLKGSDESEDDDIEDSDEKIGAFFEIKSVEGDNLKELLTGKTPSQHTIALQKLIKSYDPGLSENNKELLSRLFAHLLQYTHDVFSNVSEEGDIIKSFLIFDRLVPFFYDLIHINKVSTKKFLVELLKEKYDAYKRNPKKVPDLNTLIFFKLVSTLYPTSDFRHPVVTPSLIFMSDILTSARFTDAYSVSRGFFIVSLILEYTVLSKRYVPAAVNFLRGVIYLCANTCVLNPVQVVPPFRLHKSAKILILERDCSHMTAERKMAAKDLAATEIDDSLKIRCILTATLMLKEFFDNYMEIEALEAIFEPHIQLLGRVDLDLYPKKVSKKISEVVTYMKQNLEVKTYTQMSRDKVKPKALRLYEPDIQDVFTGSKSSKLSKENADRARLQGKYKKEMKGALREIRRDKAYIASVKIRQKIQSDNIRKDKVKQIYKDASIQQGELNKLKRMK
ncbi:nucleolar protein 14 homolog [Vanessa cardui]|uniref:nucleolar protein 14 homolog n=1 Tax=Vanessa cardui TaxID=171605 RepID=UPI001F135A54|nr:nucleolar protein 14 homolog [Vanessa cardui]